MPGQDRKCWQYDMKHRRVRLPEDFIDRHNLKNVVIQQYIERDGTYLAIVPSGDWNDFYSRLSHEIRPKIEPVLSGVKQGYVNIPVHLKMQFPTELNVLDLGDHVEIWSREDYQKMVKICDNQSTDTL